jgi:hypothetical protein
MLPSMLSAPDRVSLVVRGDCMAPVLDDGDRIAVRRGGRCLPGDLLAYYCPHHERMFVHRLLGPVIVRGRRKLLIQADTAVEPDTLVTCSRVVGIVECVGKASFSVPFRRRFQSAMAYIRWLTVLFLRHRVFRSR